ncbi:MAG: hypothetical protein CL447_06810 [Acidimicrobiaceae bacterium]|nr:hypothetical protein [Acidimicrobiaceae bacterium]HBU75901.1 hypothetical protein [Acidimicrobiaceae bacterium]
MGKDGDMPPQPLPGKTALVRSFTPADPSRIPVGRLGSTNEISDVACMLATNAYITGQTVSVNVGVYFTS